MMMTKVEAIKRIKIRRAELVQLHKEDKGQDARPNHDDTVNEEDNDNGYELETCGEEWKNYKDKKYVTNKELELVLRNFLKKIQCGILVI